MVNHVFAPEGGSSIDKLLPHTPVSSMKGIDLISSERCGPTVSSEQALDDGRSSRRLCRGRGAGKSMKGMSIWGLTSIPEGSN